MTPHRQLHSNQILTALPGPAYGALKPGLELVDLAFDQTIYETDQPIDHVYFPESGIVSFLTSMDKRSTLEVGVVGNEGLVGLSAFLGTRISPNKAVVRAAGSAWRVETSEFLKQCSGNDVCSAIIHRYTHLLLTQLSLVGTCNRFHPLVKRLASWLLTTSDRLGTNKVQITQEQTSNMLGVRREAVALASIDLQEQGLIAYARGKLTIVDRGGLESFACPCYGALRSEQEKYLNVGV
jgi:CRP-like cAMP-binding protein